MNLSLSTYIVIRTLINRQILEVTDRFKLKLKWEYSIRENKTIMLTDILISMIMELFSSGL